MKEKQNGKEPEELNKEKVKEILMSMRNMKNEPIVNRILGRIDMMDEEVIYREIEKIGNTEKDIKNFFEEKIKKEVYRIYKSEKLQINDIFTYGMAGNSIQLHLPMDLHPMISKRGYSYTKDMMNLYLLDALDKVHSLKQNGFYRFKKMKKIYLISPLLIGMERKFLEEFDFCTRVYTKQNLKDELYVKEHSEAKIARQLFGNQQQIGVAEIDLDKIATKEWQDKKNKKIKEFKEKGIVFIRENLSQKEK